MGAVSIDRTSLISDEAILAAINSKCEGMAPDDGTAVITWFQTDTNMYLEIHIEPPSQKALASHPERYGVISVWKFPYSWEHFEGRPDGEEALSEVRREGRRIHFALRGKTKIPLRRDLAKNRNKQKEDNRLR